MYRNKRGLQYNDFEITYREILASASIIAIMILIGFLISSKISESQLDKNEKYDKAVKIENQDIFQYGMDTNVGTAFVHGDLKAVDTVTYPEIDGEYMYIEKIKEKYTKHIRKVKHKNGKRTYYTTETYWTWDYAGSENKKCKQISFCNIVFDSNKIKIPNTDYIETIKESSHVRYKYYGTTTKYTGTIFTDLRNKTISDNTLFYKNMNIEETVKGLEHEEKWLQILFWIFWIVLTGEIVFVFYYADNEWLE